MVPYKVALVGAGGKMGCRLTDNLKSSQYQMHYLEVSSAGIERLATRGIKVSSASDVIPTADIVILAVPDIYIGKVAGEMLQQFKAGSHRRHAGSGRGRRWALTKKTRHIVFRIASHSSFRF